VDRLVDYLADDEPADVLVVDLRRWLEGSRPFRAFVEAHRDKVRKKIRTASEGDARLDVRAELAAAHALLGDRRIELTYERAGATVGGPDFTLTFRSHLAFNLEVTRWRGGMAALERQLLAKLRQLPPSVPNALLLFVDGTIDAVPDLEALLGDRRTAPFASHDVRQRLSRLGGVYAWSELGTAGHRATLWRNGSARIALPSAAARAVLLALESGPEAGGRSRKGSSGS
jgi:hypothetical protein